MDRDADIVNLARRAKLCVVGVALTAYAGYWALSYAGSMSNSIRGDHGVGCAGRLALETEACHTPMYLVIGGYTVWVVSVVLAVVAVHALWQGRRLATSRPEAYTGECAEE